MDIGLFPLPHTQKPKEMSGYNPIREYSRISTPGTNEEDDGKDLL